MVTIADLINSTECSFSEECSLVVSPDMSVRDVHDKMEDSRTDFVGIELEENKPAAVVSRKELLDGLLSRIDRAGEKLDGLKKQFDADISDQLELVQQNTRAIVEAEKNRLESAIDYMTEGLVIVGIDSRVNKCNPSAKKLFALDGKESDEEFSEALDDYGFRGLLAENIQNSVDSWGIFKMKSPSGAVIQIRWTEMVDECGDVTGTLVMLRDVTDELAGEKAKTEFIAAITHELRTPLTIIQNSVSNILAGVTGKISNKLRSYLETIESDCKRFGILVSDLLDISKIEAGNMALNRQVMHLGHSIGRIIEHHQQTANEKNLNIHWDPDAYISPVYADCKLIDQVLGNLISNAVKFSETGGTVKISSCEEDKKIVTVVEDTGPGISEIQQRHIFNKFHQVGRQAGAGYKGMGLGLAICKGVIEMHGGSIGVESIEGRGSKFYFALPKINPSLVLNKHLETLAEITAKDAEEFALMVLMFDAENQQDENCRKLIGTSIKELLDESKKFLTDKRDLALEVNDSEVVFAVSNARKRRVKTVKDEIIKFVRNLKNNSFGDINISPMIGTGIYPVDSSEIIEIEKLARQKAERI